MQSRMVLVINQKSELPADQLSIEHYIEMFLQPVTERYDVALRYH